MKIIIAPDSFKGSLSAKAVADAIEIGIRRVVHDVEIIKVPMADGGEGTVQSLVDATGGRMVSLRVLDPLCREINSFYGILGDDKTAVIEMAAASGLPLLKEEERNPMITTTYGTGQLIKHALDMGCRNIILGIGGSATNDGGAGMATALGVKFLNEQGEEIGFGGGALGELHSIDKSGMDQRIGLCKISVACDVSNPLIGLEGASYVFGPQKGADKTMVETLDENLKRYGQLLEQNLGISVLDVPGTGAAGGLGAGVLAFLNADLRRGVDIIIEATGLEGKLNGADLVITGEGMIDHQTIYGKTPYGVAELAGKYKIPVVAIAGGIGNNIEVLYNNGFNSVFSIVDRPMTLKESIDRAQVLLQDTAERIMRLFSINLHHK
ncbi:glycerate kinase [Geosporobacter subterraneus DSM 17957]|uniref:Glycerate kinase n=1 Tax=Geosporobacter subterraneus DSM 17957 TaxID=1121919 RepID=A0A1M6I0Q9_9FIRM|nr:glycerate kinase [Geosporobacter subterraneus]SHJ27864.1 glycerate kinase [Geosporobacter subterraneus DSM 17957]